MTEGTCTIEGCIEQAYCRDWCKLHYARWYRTGDPTLVRKGYRTVLGELHEGVSASTDECVVMAGRKHRPSVEFKGKRMFASRAVWIIANGEPGDLFVLHTCHRGDEGCINLRHLYLGDQGQNIRDMDRAGRGNRGNNKILSEVDVLDIRRRHVRGVNQHYPKQHRGPRR